MISLAEFIKNNHNTRTKICKPMIIAEAGVNHEGSMEIAKRLIDDAAEAQADAIKFQTYRAETLASKDSPSYWDTSKEPTRSQYELFKKHDKFWKKEFEELKKHCDNAGIEFCSTPFDVESAKFLNDLMSVFKISSSDITNKPFIENLCNYQKPIILSTGASNLTEIENAVNWIKKSSNPLAILHCILNYPTPDHNANLNMIMDLKNSFPAHMIGYSDHTLPNDMQVLISATLLGARIIEKHFTHDKTLPGNDHYHAMDKNDLVNFNLKIKSLLTTLGESHKRSIPDEQPARINARRSLVAKKDISVGSVIEFNDLTWKRPAFGIPPSEIDRLIGLRTKVNIREDDVLKWEMFDI